MCMTKKKEVNYKKWSLYLGFVQVALFFAGLFVGEGIEIAFRTAVLPVTGCLLFNYVKWAKSGDKRYCIVHIVLQSIIFVLTAASLVLTLMKF